nr:hypothetical protein [uncultured Roseateles sp.]
MSQRRQTVRLYLGGAPRWPYVQLLDQSMAQLVAVLAGLADDK